MLRSVVAFTFLVFALPAAAQSVSGTVNRSDATQGNLTVNHGPIKSLDMDAMTMVFRAGDPVIVEGLKAGDRIRFGAERVNGQLAITTMKKVK